MKKMEQTRFKMNAKTVKKAMVMSTLVLTLAATSLPSFAYAADAIEEGQTDSLIETGESTEEKLPIPTEGIPVVSPDGVPSGVPSEVPVVEKEVPVVEKEEPVVEEEVQTGPIEKEEVDSTTSSDASVPTTRGTPSNKSYSDDEVTEVSTEVEFKDALINKMPKIKLVKSITLSSIATINKDVIIDLGGNLLNVGTFSINVDAKNVSIENGRLNGVGTLGAFVNTQRTKGKQIKMSNITFSGTHLIYTIKGNYISPTFDLIFEGENDIRSNNNLVNSMLIKKNASVNYVGSLVFATSSLSSEIDMEDSSTLNMDLEGLLMYMKILTIGENASFTAIGKKSIFYMDSPINSLTIDAKKNSTFNVKVSDPGTVSSVFHRGSHNLYFDQLKYLNMEVNGKVPVFASGSTGNMTIVDSDLSVWSTKDMATNGRPTNTWDIMGRFEIANFTNTSRTIFSNNPIIDKEFGQLNEYKRISNGAVTAKPVFSGVQSKVTIPVGTAFNPTDGITATDRIDGDITDKIDYSIADDKTIDTSKPGSYTITYTVENSNGNKAQAVTELIVEEKKIAKTTIFDLDTTSTTVSGTGEPNGLIEIKANQQVIATGTVGSDGKYTIEIPKQIADVTVTAIVKVNNQTSDASTIVKNGEIAKTTISDLDTTSTTVSGLGEPNGLIEIKANQQVIATGTVGSDGKYTIQIPKQSAGVTVTAIVKANNQISEASTIVKNGEIAKTTISKIDNATTFISGTGEPNGAITLSANGTILASGKVDSAGKYSFTIAKQAVGVTVLAKVTLNGKESEASTIVTKTPEELVAPVIHDYYTSDINAKGTIGGSAKQVAIYVNGVKKRTAAVTNGNFTIYTGDLGLTVAGQSFQIAGLSDGVEGPKTTKIVEARNQLIAPTINDYYTTDANVSGTITGSAKQVAIFVDGVQKRTAAVKNGKYVIYTGDLGLTTPGKKFQVAGIDGIMVGPKTEATVKNKQQLVAPTINDYYTINVNASGTIGGTAKQVVIFVDGVQKRTAAVNGGKYVIYTGDLGLTTAGKTFEIAGIDGSAIGPKTKMIVKQKEQLVVPKINDYYTTDVNASGTITGSVEKVAIFVDGVQKRTAAVNGGKYVIYTGDLGLTTAGKTFQIAGISGLTVGPKAEMIVKQKVQLAAPQINPYYTTDTFASGTVTGEAERVAIFVDGIQKRTTTVVDGKYTIYSGDLGLTTTGKTFEIAGIKDSIVGMKAKMTVIEKP